jgi:hypothetical protein
MNFIKRGNNYDKMGIFKNKTMPTKIEIEYNGAYAICKVNGKYFNECDSLTKAKALGAFRCIEQDFRRTNNLQK